MEAASGRSSFLKLSEVLHIPKEEQMKYWQADASCLIFSNSVCPDAISCYFRGVYCLTEMFKCTIQISCFPDVQSELVISKQKPELVL